jgi:hypothetical protein
MIAKRPKGGWTLSECIITLSGAEKIKCYGVPVFGTREEAQAHLEKVCSDPPFVGRNIQVTHWTPKRELKPRPQVGRKHPRR